MADPITLGIVAMAGMGAMGSIMGGVQQSEQFKQAATANKYNETVLKQQGTQASNSAASNEATSIRRSSGDLGEQAAAFAESGVGTGGSTGQVERQSATNARMDQLNIWYGGELQRKSAFDAASLERYNELINKRNADSALISGFTGAGTKAVMGGIGAKTGNPAFVSSGGSGTF